MKGMFTRLFVCCLFLSGAAATTALAGVAYGFFGPHMDIPGPTYNAGVNQYLTVSVSPGAPVRATADGRINSTSNSYHWDSYATDVTPWVGTMVDVEHPLWVVRLSTRQTVQVSGDTNAPLVWGIPSYYYSAEAAHVGFGRVDGVSLVYGGGHLLVGNNESDVNGIWDYRTSSTDGFVLYKRTRSSGSVTNEDSTGWPTHADSVAKLGPTVIVDFSNQSSTLRLVHRPFVYAFPEGAQFSFGHEVSLAVNTVGNNDGKITGFALARDLATGQVLEVFQFD